MDALRCRHIKSRSLAVTETEKAEVISRDSSNISRRQSLKHKLSCCFNDGQSPAPFSRSLSLKRGLSLSRGHKRDESDISTTTMAEDDKPRYVHVPQHAGSSHLTSTSPVPFNSRAFLRDTYIEPIQTSAQKAAEMRRLGRERAEQGGRPILVGCA